MGWHYNHTTIRSQKFPSFNLLRNKVLFRSYSSPLYGLLQGIHTLATRIESNFQNQSAHRLLFNKVSSALQFEERDTRVILQREGKIKNPIFLYYLKLYSRVRWPNSRILILNGPLPGVNHDKFSPSINMQRSIVC